jgi:flagellar hook-associated protein 3 FlgL
MERVTNDQMQRALITNIHTAQRRLMETTDQLSSGYRISKPSDDAIGAPQVLDLLTHQTQLDQYDKNLDAARAWSISSESALSQSQDIVQRVRTLTLQAANDSASASSRASTAAEINNLIDSIKSLANSKLGDQYLFSGTKTDIAPYQAPPSDTYWGDNGSVLRVVGAGQQIEVNVTADQVWGNSASGLIQAMRTIAANLTTNSSASITQLRSTDLQNLDSSISNLTAMQAQLGATQNRLDVQTQHLGDLALANQELLSITRDTDIAVASAEYSQRAAALNAALKTGQQIVQPSLMDFIR